MSLLDKFRPDWKHSDADVRADAVRLLGPSAVETLTELARTDPDAKVRSLAMRKLEDPDLLLELSKSDEDEKLRNLAHERAASLLIETACGEDEAAALAALGRLSRQPSLAKVAQGAASSAVRDRALSSLTEADAILTVIDQAADTGTRIQAVGALQDASKLKKVALHQHHGDIAQAAFERLEDPKDWLEVADRAEVKAVRQLAQERLGSLPDEDHPTRLGERADKLEGLIATVEGLARSEAAHSRDWNTTRDAIEEARSQWIELGGSQDDALGQRFFAAREVFIQRYKEHLDQQAAPKQAQGAEPASSSPASEAAPAAAEAEDFDPAPWLALCETVEGLGKDGAAEHLAQAKKAFEDLGALPKKQGSEISNRFRSAVSALEDRLGMAEAAEETRAQQEELCAAAQAAVALEKLDEAVVQWREIQNRWHGLEATLPELKERFTTAAKAMQERLGENEKEQSQAARNNLSRLTGLADRLEAMVATEELSFRKAERTLRDAAAALQRHGSLPDAKNDWPPLKKRLEAVRDSLQPRLRQMEQEEEWKRWANVPLQEALIERMEALIDTADLAHASKELRVCSDEWKQVASAPREKSEELWQRFRAAREKVRDRVKVFQQEQDQQRKENLKLKIALCEQAEAVADSTEWRTTADSLKALQAEWKKTGPVPRKQSDEIWKRFRKACDTFFDARKAHFSFMDQARDANLAKKEALIERAETLAESNEWETTTNKLKGLQAEWKNIGPVPRRVSDDVWSRFRKACDTFFDRRSRKDELPLEDNLAKKEAALAELTALLPPPPKPAPPKAAEEPKAEEPKAEEPKTEEAKTEEAKTEEPKAESTAEAAADAETPTAEADQGAAEAEQTPAEEAPAEEAAAESAPTEEAFVVPDDLADRIQAAREAWKGAGAVPRGKQVGMDERFTEISNRLIATYPEQLAGTELDPAVLAETRGRLADRAETLVTETRKELEEAQKASEPSLQDLAAQLREAFAANTIRRGAQTEDTGGAWREAKPKIEGLRRRFQELPGEADPKITKRIEKAFKAFATLEPKRDKAKQGPANKGQSKRRS